MPGSGANLDFSFDGDLRQCPWSAIPERDEGPAEHGAFALERAWELWTTLGILPYGGAMAEQPVFVVEAFELCELARQLSEAKAAAKDAGARRRDLLSLMQSRG